MKESHISDLTAAAALSQTRVGRNAYPAGLFPTAKVYRRHQCPVTDIISVLTHCREGRIHAGSHLDVIVSGHCNILADNQPSLPAHAVDTGRHIIIGHTHCLRIGVTIQKCGNLFIQIL